MDINGKVALVTGAAIGIGFEISKELLRNGVQGVLLTDVNEENGRNAIDILSKEFDNDRFTFFKTDVTKEDEFEEAFKKAISNFGKIDILVNNAGIMNDKNYDLEININLTGVIRGILLAHKYLGKDQNGNGGTILNICSTTAVELHQFFPIYSSTKAGVLNLTKGFGHPFHYNRTGVSVIALCPGKTETALQAVDFLFEGCQDELFKAISGQDLQMPDAVARAAIHVMTNGKSGTIWMIDQNKLYTFHLPEWETLRQIVINKI